MLALTFKSDCHKLDVNADSYAQTRLTKIDAECSISIKIIGT